MFFAFGCVKVGDVKKLKKTWYWAHLFLIKLKGGKEEEIKETAPFPCPRVLFLLRLSMSQCDALLTPAHSFAPALSSSIHPTLCSHISHELWRQRGRGGAPIYRPHATSCGPSRPCSTLSLSLSLSLPLPLHPMVTSHYKGVCISKATVLMQAHKRSLFLLNYSLENCFTHNKAI